MTTPAASQVLPGTPMLRVLAAAVQARVPVLLWGKPGVGKTSRVTSLAKAWDAHLEVVVGSIRDATDYLGFPLADANGLHYEPPTWAKNLARAPRGIAFFDEFNRSSGSVFNAQLRVIQEGFVGDLRLPETVSFVGAANPPDVAGDVNELPAPMANRFLHLDWDFDRAGWLAGLVHGFEAAPEPSLRELLTDGSTEQKLRAASVVATFTHSAPQHIEPAVPDALGATTDNGRYASSYAFASPRSWHNLARLLTYLRPTDTSAIMLAALGLVGDGVGREFLTWYNAAGLYDPRAVLEGTVTVAWTTDTPDRLYALTQAVVAIALGDRKDSTYEQALNVLLGCGQAGRKDVAVPALRTLLSRLPQTVELPHGMREVFADVVLAA